MEAPPVQKPEPEPEPVTEPDLPPVITDREVDRLMATLALSYEKLDARAYAAHFARNATTTDARGRRAIEKSYRQFFKLLQDSRFETAGLRWSPPAVTREGSGTIRVHNHYTGTPKPTVASFDMRFVLQRGEDGVRIQRMDYQ